MIVSIFISQKCLISAYQNNVHTRARVHIHVSPPHTHTDTHFNNELS